MLSLMSPTFAVVSVLASAGKDVALGSMLGTSDGPKVGGDDGGSDVSVGMGEGSSEGISVGGDDGGSEGVTVGEVEGCPEGITVGGREGVAVGSKEGVCVGEMEGIKDGSIEGASVGEKVDNLHRQTISCPRLKSPTQTYSSARSIVGVAVVGPKSVGLPARTDVGKRLSFQARVVGSPICR
jgi:hypothetical protein